MNSVNCEESCHMFRKMPSKKHAYTPKPSCRMLLQDKPSYWHRGLAGAFCCLGEFALAFCLSCSQGSRAQELHRWTPEPGTLLLIILVISFVLNDILGFAFALDFVGVRILLAARGRSVAKDSQENSSFLPPQRGQQHCEGCFYHRGCLCHRNGLRPWLPLNLPRKWSEKWRSNLSRKWVGASRSEAALHQILDLDNRSPRQIPREERPKTCNQWLIRTRRHRLLSPTGDCSSHCHGKCDGPSRLVKRSRPKPRKDLQAARCTWGASKTCPKHS